MYIKIKNNITTYPYNINLLYTEHPNTSFPDNIWNDLNTLKDFGVFRVTETQKPQFNPLLEKCVELIPILIGDTWTKQWQVEPLTAEEIQILYDSKAAEVRAERNRLLLETDWTQFKDIEAEISDKYTLYRQSLRDVSSQLEFPFNVTWPNVADVVINDNITLNNTTQLNLFTV